MEEVLPPTTPMRNAGKTLNINEMTIIKDNGKLKVKCTKIPHSA